MTPLALDALELAARLGHPGLPLIVERQAAASLLGLVAATGHPLAAGLANMTFPVTVSLLGGFGVTRGGRAVDVPPGQGRQLVKLVAAAGGRLTAEAAMEALWPEADPDASANRLRTVLHQLEDAAGDVVIREGRQLCLGPDVHTDVQAFTGDGRRARLEFLDSYDARFVIVTQGPIDEALAYKRRVGNTMTWYSTADSSLRRASAPRPAAGSPSTCSCAMATPCIAPGTPTAAAPSSSAYTFGLIDLLPYEQQEEWQDSPEGWPQSPAYSRWGSSEDVAALYGPDT